METGVALGKLNRRGDSLWIAPQNVTEFYATLTRPITRNGLGRTCAEALRDVAIIKRVFGLLDDRAEVLAA